MLGPIFVLFILIVGAATVAAAISFVLKPRERTLAVLRPLSASTAFATLSAVMAGVTMTLKNAADVGFSTQALVAGLAETAVAGVLGFALLAVAWLLAALGLRRQT